MKIKIDYSYYLLVISFLLCGLFSNIIILSMIVIVHELGHLFMAHINKFKIYSITLYSFGGLTKLDIDINSNIYRELLVSIGGFLFQILLYIVFYYLYRVGIIREYYYNIFNNYNISIMLFNLLPIYSLDGSKILSLLLYIVLPYKIVNMAVIIISFITMIIFLIYSFSYSVIVMFIIFIINIIIFYKKKDYLFNRFLLERYINNYRYKNIVIKKIDNMYKNKNHLFKIKDKIYSEKYILWNRFK